MNITSKRNRQATAILCLTGLLSVSGPVHAQRLPTSPPPFNPTLGRSTVIKPTVQPMQRVVVKPQLTHAQINQALIAEAYRGNLAQATAFLAQGADPNARASNGTSALTFATSGKSLPMVKLLISKGAKVNLVDPRGNTALIVSAAVKDLPILEYLLDKGAAVNIHDNAGYSPLSIAVAQNNLPMLTALIAHKADVNAPQHGGATPIAVATALSFAGIVHALLEAHASAAPAAPGQPSLLWGALAGSRRPGVDPAGIHAIMLDLLEHGADPNPRAANNGTPLILSAAMGDTVSARLLIEHGAKVDAQDTSGRDALLIAAAQGHDAMVPILIANNANVNMQDTQGYTPLLWACRYNHAAIARELLQAGARVTLANKQGVTPLLAACWKGNIELTTLLMSKGASIKTSDHMGNTPLMMAALCGSAPLVKLLLAKGADANAHTTQGATAANYANGKKPVLDLLLPHMAAVNRPGSIQTIAPASKYPFLDPDAMIGLPSSNPTPPYQPTPQPGMQPTIVHRP